MLDETFDYPAYLAVKKLIDDSSMNRDVWDGLIHWLEPSNNNPLNILEIGAGTGTMVERLLDTGLLNAERYVAIEQEPDFRDIAFENLENWCQANRYQFNYSSDEQLNIFNDDKPIEFHWQTGDITKLIANMGDREYDLIIGHAVIDLLPVPECLPGILDKVRQDGRYFFSLNFSGNTIFSPSHEQDDAVISAYHADMDSRFTDVDWQPSMTGKLLGAWLNSNAYEVLTDGPSDWQLPLAGITREDNRLFITNLIDTIANALDGMPGLNNWLSDRRTLLDENTLKLVITNHDYFGRVP